MSQLPSDPFKLIGQLASEHLGASVSEIKRFSTGLTHYVYDVGLEDGSTIVVRLAIGENRQELKNGLYWQSHLAKVGVRLPEIYASGEMGEIDFALIERLPGEDIELIYHTLSNADKKAIAAELINFQSKVSQIELNLFDRFFKKPRPQSDIIKMILRRCDYGFNQLGCFNLTLVSTLREAFEKIESELDQLPMIPFLYDTSVKNVIIDQGRVSGFIDVDEVWLGDPLLAVGRCKALSLCRGWDMQLADSWIDQLNLNPNEHNRVKLYTALYCVRTMSILGGKYNGNILAENDLNRAKEVESISENYFSSVRLTA